MHSPSKDAARRGGEGGDFRIAFVYTYIRAAVVLFIRRILQFDRDRLQTRLGEVELSAIYRINIELVGLCSLVEERWSVVLLLPVDFSLSLPLPPLAFFY